MLRLRLFVLLGALGMLGMGAAALAPAAGAALTPSGKQKLNCWYSTAACVEIGNPEDIWGNWYVGHDEPSVLFYSNRPGSGNDMTYRMKLPSDPAGPFPSDPFSLSKSYNFELHPAFWFGLAMCDTQSYPEQVSSCPPDSDRNIVDVTKSTRHPGTAFEELQFYSPGWVKQFNGYSCDPTKWCAALNIDSLAEDPINGTTLNATCQSQILGGIEYINFAYLTRNGRPQGPPNPLQFDPVASGDPGPTVLYMNSGDMVDVTLRDTPHGLLTAIYDENTHQFGWMIASAANGFGQIKYDPSGTSCTEIPYDFHPMYSTSSPKTTVPWAAHSYNVAFSDEIGHFDFCTAVDASTGNCTGLEGPTGDQEPTEGGITGDDYGCFTAAQSLFYPATGCTATNTPGFDGVPYQLAWPDGSPNRPTPVLFTSPTSHGQPYSQAAFEADLPRIEASDLGGNCNRSTGAGCSNPPPTDDGAPATFYPYYSTVSVGGDGRGDHGDRNHGCMWGLGSTLPNTIENFGANSTAEYGPLYGTYYYVFGGHGATEFRYNNYHRALPNNPC
jgi:hypothetical protein